jgi:hypothetical protein
MQPEKNVVASCECQDETNLPSLPDIDQITFSRSELNEVRNLFNEAEKALKTVEHLHGEGIIVPAINELRYAGNHLLRAAAAIDPDEKQKNIERAKNHCKRAHYDAIEIGVIAYLEKFDKFHNDYRLIPIRPVIPEYPHYLKVRRTVLNFVEDASPEQRHKFHTQLDSYFKELKEILDNLEDYREDLNKSMAIRRMAALTSFVMIALAIPGAIAAYFQLSSSDTAADNYFRACIEAFAIANPKEQQQGLDYCNKKYPKP